MQERFNTAITCRDGPSALAMVDPGQISPGGFQVCQSVLPILRQSPKVAVDPFNVSSMQPQGPVPEWGLSLHIKAALRALQPIPPEEERVRRFGQHPDRCLRLTTPLWGSG